MCLVCSSNLAITLDSQDESLTGFVQQSRFQHKGMLGCNHSFFFVSLTEVLSRQRTEVAQQPFAPIAQGLK